MMRQNSNSGPSRTFSLGFGSQAVGRKRRRNEKGEFERRATRGGEVSDVMNRAIGGPMSGLRLCFSGFSDEKKGEFHSLVTRNGGR